MSHSLSFLLTSWNPPVRCWDRENYGNNNKVIALLVVCSLLWIYFDPGCLESKHWKEFYVLILLLYFPDEEAEVQKGTWVTDLLMARPEFSSRFLGNHRIVLPLLCTADYYISSCVGLRVIVWAWGGEGKLLTKHLQKHKTVHLCLCVYMVATVTFAPRSLCGLRAVILKSLGNVLSTFLKKLRMSPLILSLATGYRDINIRTIVMQYNLLSDK